MPDGFMGNPAAIYLNKIYAAHNIAAAAISAVGDNAPTLIPIPYHPETANEGSYNTGYDSSQNIVANAGDYGTVASIIADMDRRIGQMAYNIASGILEMTDTIFVIPKVVNKTTDFTNNMLNTLGGFITLTDNKAALISGFGGEIAGVG